MTETEFFEAFDAERWNFTFMAEENPAQAILQVGLVAVFYIVDAFLPIRRKHIAEALGMFYERYSENLKWGFVLSPDEKMVEQSCTEENIKKCQDYIVGSSSNDALSFRWSSTPGFLYSSSYLFSVYSPAGWFERIHGDMTCVRIYLPVEAIRGDGRRTFEGLVHELCNVLRPLHGAAGLGLQESYEWEDFQHVEYEMAWSYRGLDVCGPFAPKAARNGYRSLNWYTYLAHHWLKKLGSPEDLRARLDDERIEVIPYDWGSMIRAGDWPALGKADVDPRPELYVKVNDAIRSLRVQDIGSLHYGSIAGEVRFNPRTSNLWLRRFDSPEEVKDAIDASGKVKTEERQFLRVPSGTPCPWPGVWICEEVPHVGKQTFAHGVRLPEVDGQAVTWRLVKAL